MVLIDFGSFSHLLEKYEIFLRLSKTVNFGLFWAKSMAIAHGFDRFLGHFHTFWKNTKYFWGFRKLSILAIFEQKAWAIAHGFDRFWVIFTPFGKIRNISEAFENCQFWPFWAKSMGYSPWFWSILGHFHTFWKNTKYFWGFRKLSILAIFEQKAWAIAHGFDRFWGIFTPFGKIRNDFWGCRKSCQNWAFLSKKHGL